MSPNTYFIDIDGTILFYKDDFFDVIDEYNLPALPLVKETICKWHCQGSKVILVTARPESMRQITEIQLANAGIIYNTLLMEIGSGVRVMINDLDPLYPDMQKAIAINLPRNSGFTSINS